MALQDDIDANLPDNSVGAITPEVMRDTFNLVTTQMTLDQSFETIPAVNRTGSTIPKGTPCRHDGVDATLNLPNITAAQADTLIHSRVMGVTGEDVLDNATTNLITFGRVDGVDLSGLAEGQPMYLSATVAGAVTATPPDLATQVGGVLNNDVSGTVFVFIINHISLPTLFGVLRDIGATYNLTTSYQDLNNYAVEKSVLLEVDGAVGEITCPDVGWWRASFTLSMTLPSASQTRTITVQGWNTTTASESFSSTISVPKDATSASRSIAVPFEVAESSDVKLRISSSTDITGVTFDVASFDVESISLTA